MDVIEWFQNGIEIFLSEKCTLLIIELTKVKEISEVYDVLVLVILSLY